MKLSSLLSRCQCYRLMSLCCFLVCFSLNLGIFVKAWSTQTGSRKWWSLYHHSLPAVNSLPENTIRRHFTKVQWKQFFGFHIDGTKARGSISKPLIEAVVVGLKRAVTECTIQMKKHRWNCTVFAPNHPRAVDVPVLGNIATKGVPESAFFHSLLSATITQTVAEACLHKIDNCPCNHRGRRAAAPEATWQWRGCDHNVIYGRKIARRLLDSAETGWRLQYLMNKHNNRVGRKYVVGNLRKYCNCYGTSGSCTLKTCFRKTPFLKDIGAYIKEKYNKAVRVIRDNVAKPRASKFRRRNKGNNRNRNRRRHRSRVSGLIRAVSIAPIGSPLNRPRSDELVYLQEPPGGRYSYCEPDTTLGLAGTHGRLCNSTSPGPDNCKTLCCGRETDSASFYAYEDCHCRFEFCCKVICEQCTVYKTEERCQ